MIRPFAPLVAFLIALSIPVSASARSVVIVADPEDALAAKEVRRYVYLRTGSALPIVGRLDDDEACAARVVIGTKDRACVRAVPVDAKTEAEIGALAEEQYLLKTCKQNGQSVLLVVGGDPIGTLYGAYRLAEHLGVRFYLHGDVVPDQQTKIVLPELNELGKPLFHRRGIQPFHDFPEGPDWWNAADYKALLAQLAKLRKRR